MSVQSAYFDLGVKAPKIFDDYILAPKTSKDGSTTLEPTKVDYPSIIKTNGYVDAWSLDNLLAAGINPASISVHTSSPSRLESVDMVNGVLAEIPENNENEKNED